jgi:hypothetical protein
LESASDNTNQSPGTINQYLFATLRRNRLSA